jgi:hypothetical protein
VKVFIGSTYSLVSVGKLFLAGAVVDGGQLPVAAEYLFLTSTHMRCNFPLAP